MITRILLLGSLLLVSGWQYAQNKSTTARETVLFEIGTSVGCANCTSVTEAMDSLRANGKNASIIKYQYADQFESEDGFNRKEFYEITANPTIIIDGKERILGGGYQMNLYPEYLEKYETYIAEPSTMEIEMEILQVEGRSYKINISVAQLELVHDTKLNLRIALLESHIPHDWFYLNEVNFVCRDMLWTDKGFKLDFSEDTVNTFELDYEIDTAYNISNCEIVAFVQHDGSLEIMQAVQAFIPYETVGLNDEFFEPVTLYPNPVGDRLFLKGITKADNIQIRNIIGQLIFETSNISLFENGFETSSLAKGTYALIIQHENNSKAIKFIK